MKGHLAKTVLIIFCISFFHLFSIHEARSEDPGLTAGGFQWGGNIELGYRFKDIDGSKNRYKEVVNLEDGLRLFDFNLWGKSLEPGKGMVDYFSLSARDIGDPFPAARLEIKKNKTYDFVATYKEYKYFFDREDNTFFTDNHNFSQKTRRGTLTLSVFPKDDVRVTAGYSYTGRDGDAGVPSLTFPFAMDQNLKEQMHDFFVSADFPIANWDFHVKQEYWNYKNKDEIGGPQFEKQNDQINTYVSTIKAHTKFGERLDLDTGYIFAHSEGDARLTTLPEIGVNSGKGSFNYNTHIFELGLSYLLMSKLIAHFDYRFHTIDQEGHGNTDPLLAAPANTPTKFDESAHTGTIQLEYLPRENLTLRAGYRFQYRTVDGNDFVVNQFDGGKHPADTDSWTHGWIASADWKPFKFLTFYGEYQGANFENPYTWISPESENVARFKVKYDTPVENLSLKGTFQWRRKRNPDQNFTVDTQDYSITATYLPLIHSRTLLRRVIHL